MSRRTRRSFTPEFRARTVELIESSGRSNPDICRELKWVEHLTRQIRGVHGNGSSPWPPGLLGCLRFVG